MNEIDMQHLRASISAAWSAREHGNHPFGAVLVDEHNQEVLRAENTVVTGRDSTGHAETNLVRLATQDNVISEMEAGLRTTVVQSLDTVFLFFLRALAAVLPSTGPMTTKLRTGPSQSNAPSCHRGSDTGDQLKAAEANIGAARAAFCPRVARTAAAGVVSSRAVTTPASMLFGFMRGVLLMRRRA